MFNPVFKGNLQNCVDSVLHLLVIQENKIPVHISITIKINPIKIYFSKDIIEAKTNIQMSLIYNFKNQTSTF